MTLGNIVLAGARSVSTTASRVPVGPLEFIESPWGLNMKLYPVQRIIIKAHYGIALDDKVKFTITDWRRQNPRQMTEKEYLEYLYDNGRCNIREVIPGKQRRKLVLSLGRRSGKCVVGDTLVLTDSGIFPIRELGDPNGLEVQPLDVGVTQEGHILSRSAYFYNGGVKDTLKVETYLGVGVEGTPNHRVRVLGTDGVVSWRRLDEIKEDDHLGVSRGDNLWATNLVNTAPYRVKAVRSSATPQPTVFGEDLGLLMGYLVGDGSWTTKGSLKVTAEHGETKEELRGLFLKVFGRVQESRDKRTEATVNIGVYDKAYREFFHNLGFAWDRVSDNKSTPWVILRSPKKVVAAYLQGLFETDGTVAKDGLAVSFCSASRKLAEETQVLLLNFGVVSRIRVRHNRVYNRDYYELVILGNRSRQIFAAEIGFRSRKKNSRLELGLIGTREGGYAETIPHQAQWVTKLLASIPVGKKTPLRLALGNVCKPGSGEDLTYSRLKGVLPMAISLGADPEIVDHFRGLLDSDYHFTKVVAVTPGVKPVFDLNVPKGESFVANGLTNHNTSVSACIFGYETYKLILMQDPQAYYGLPATNNIQLIAVATDRDQAGLLYQEASGHFKNCSFFAPYIANNTQSYARFQTPKDLERYGSYADDPKAKATIKVTFRSCVAKGLRGAGNIVIVLDEVAHFTDEGQSSAEAVYDAVAPSAAAYSPKDPNDKTVAIGEVESRIILISSPMGRQGLFYKMFQMGMSGGLAAEDMLCIEAPTWEVNPSLEAGFMESSFQKNPTVFFTEFGGQFTNRTSGWIERDQDLLDCVAPEARPQVRGLPRIPYFLGLDLGLVGDGTAIAIGHLDEGQRIHVDLVEQMKAGEGKYHDKERLDFDDVADWILDLSKRFYLAEGIFDQWAGIPFEQALAKRGLSQMKSDHITKVKASQMYQNFKDMMWDHRLVLYNHPIPPNELFCPYMKELTELQAQYQTKYVTIVEAPNIDGKHDDQSDALIRMVWLASNRVSKMGHFAVPGVSTGVTGFGSRVVSPRLKRLQSGTHESRFVPRKPKRLFR